MHPVYLEEEMISMNIYLLYELNKHTKISWKTWRSIQSRWTYKENVFKKSSPS
jgi:hypothetical protein